MDSEYVKRAKIFERRLNDARRNIVGVSNINVDNITDREAQFFEARLDSSRFYWEEYRTAYIEWQELCIEDGRDDFPTQEWQAQYDTLQLELIQADASLRIIRNMIRAAHEVPSTPTGAANTTHNVTLTAPKLHLPDIPIPTFSGDLLKWTTFRDTYVSLIHNEDSLSNVQKFHYLLGALKGEAASVISKFTVDEQSYERAWAKVKSTYDNPRVLANLLVQRILDCDTSTCRGDLQRYDAFLSGVADSVEAFRALQLEDPGEFLLSSLALRALDAETRRRFELSLGSSSELPKIDKIVDFVKQRRMALKMAQEFGTPSSSSKATKPTSFKRNTGISLHVSSSKTTPLSKQHVQNSQQRLQQRFATPSQHTPASFTSNMSCPHCQSAHPIYQCEQFLQSALQDRLNLVQRYNLCLNCLNRGHRISSCHSKFRCRTCGKRHHSLIHETPQPPTVQQPVLQQTGPEKGTFTDFGSEPLPSPARSMVLLGTVRILIKGPRGDYHQARAVLDSGSQHSFITTGLARRIGSKLKAFGGTITSLGEAAVSKSILKGTTHCTIRPSTGDKELEVSAVVVESISSSLPSSNLPESLIKQLANHPLADCDFGTSGAIDMLIGGDIYLHVIIGTPQHTGIYDLFFHPTIFGLVVSGSMQNTESPLSHSFFLDSRPSIEEQLKAFWELEEPAPADRRIPEDIFCEEHFKKTHYRTPEGRYVVRLPFKSEHPDVGSNRDMVFRRFYALEARFRKDPPLSEKYLEFMNEYAQLNHLFPATIQSPYLIPHHGVWQERPQGRKLRVVFDASCPSNKQSLNDVLYAGPKLQEDLCMILIRFRLYAVAVCSDLVKMYRQVLLHPYDRRYQHIIWRDNSSSAIQEMELNTVTYGIKSSAFQAIRVVRQLVQDEGVHFPLAACRIPQDMYVDDIVSGADNEEEAIELIDQLVQLFSKGGFELAKWASNLPHLLPPSSTSSSDPPEVLSILPPEEDGLKVLGLHWNPSTDAFSYSTQPPPTVRATKRIMLSAVARIFDPLGLLAPIIFLAKTLIQEIWKINLDWDEELPGELQSVWSALTSEWALLSRISIPRYITHFQASLQVIGFCDASAKGYAAALYLRSEAPTGEVKVSLIKAKSKVAPLRYQSIARLELCGALLLSRIVTSITLNIPDEPICFTDSKVVLSWLQTPTHELQTFEANRVSQILSSVQVNRWCHVASEDNPADIASRGSVPKKLKAEPLWWNGPAWLQRPISQWFQPCKSSITLTAISKKEDIHDDWTTRFSSFTTLVRTVVRMLRFARKICLRSHDSQQPLGEAITATEFSEAELRCIMFIQHTYLPRELFKGDSTIPKEYAPLSPFLDERGVVRVGGRLQESSLPYSAKHPILLPSKAHFTRLLVNHVHANNFHAGPTLCLSLLRSRFWIPRALKLIRGITQRCVHCRIHRAKPLTPVMAPLPRGRFDSTRAFTQVGVDYAGPLMIKESKRRNASLGKAYICLFICFANKAVHLELVSSLSTPSFLAALDRFISRRGLPSDIWSDHGTNFVGASKFLKELFKAHHMSRNQILEHLSPRGVSWHFIPPRAPHFGGLWEAGVKSVKRLLVNSVGKNPHTFEELTTIHSRIEALLNSRPLCPLSEDVENFEFLTPGHFIIGAPLNSLPSDSDPSGSLPSAITRWKMVKAYSAHIWSRWRREYLHTLQQRSKWVRKVPGLKNGDLVILIEKRSVEGQWPVARVVQTFPGRDGVTRSVLVKTPSGTQLTRAATSLVPLFFPVSEKEQ